MERINQTPQIKTTKIQPQTVSSDRVAKILEGFGWKKSIAGDDDFDRAVKALCTMYATGRGLLLTGEAGCGKTALLRAIRKGMNVSGQSFFYCKDVEDLEYIKSSTPYICQETVIVDDIGVEDVVQHFGNKIDIIGDFIQQYYYRGKGRFICSSNLDAKQIREKYGSRVLDRLLEMCVVMKFNGGSKRERIII